MLFEVGSTLFHHFKGIHITFIGGITPGKQAVGTQHDTPDARIFIQALFQLQTKVKTRFLPVYPANGSIEQVFSDLAARNSIARISHAERHRLHCLHQYFAASVPVKDI